MEAVGRTDRRAAQRGSHFHRPTPRAGRFRGFEVLPVAARVHEAVVGADVVHPRHPLGRGRRVQGVEDYGTASLPRSATRLPSNSSDDGRADSGSVASKSPRRQRRASRCSWGAGRATAPAGGPLARGPWLPNGCQRRRSSWTSLALGASARIQRCYEDVEPSVVERTTLSIRRAQADGFGSGTSSASRTPRPISAAQRKTTRVSMSASGSRCSDC